MKHLIKAVTWDGKEVLHVESVELAGEYTEDELLKKAGETNPQLADILAKEPSIVYDSSGRVVNVEEIKSANYVIIVPLE